MVCLFAPRIWIGFVLIFASFSGCDSPHFVPAVASEGELVYPLHESGKIITDCDADYLPVIALYSDNFDLYLGSLPATKIDSVCYQSGEALCKSIREFLPEWGADLSEKSVCEMDGALCLHLVPLKTPSINSQKTRTPDAGPSLERRLAIARADAQLAREEAEKKRKLAEEREKDLGSDDPLTNSSRDGAALGAKQAAVKESMVEDLVAFMAASEVGVDSSSMDLFLYRKSCEDIECTYSKTVILKILKERKPKGFEITACPQSKEEDFRVASYDINDVSVFNKYVGSAQIDLKNSYFTDQESPHFSVKIVGRGPYPRNDYLPVPHPHVYSIDAKIEIADPSAFACNANVVPAIYLNGVHHFLEFKKVEDGGSIIYTLSSPIKPLTARMDNSRPEKLAVVLLDAVFSKKGSRKLSPLFRSEIYEITWFWNWDDANGAPDEKPSCLVFQSYYEKGDLNTNISLDGKILIGADPGNATKGGNLPENIYLGDCKSGGRYCFTVDIGGLGADIAEKEGLMSHIFVWVDGQVVRPGYSHESTWSRSCGLLRGGPDDRIVGEIDDIESGIVPRLGLCFTYP